MSAYLYFNRECNFKRQDCRVMKCEQVLKGRLKEAASISAFW